jgi:hypothetical protein
MTKWGLLVVERGFEDEAYGCGNYVNHGDEGLVVATSSGSCVGGLEERVQAFMWALV